VGSYSTIAQLLPGRQVSPSETTLASRNGTRWSANSQAAVILVDDVVVIAVHREPQSLAWHWWHRQMSRKRVY